jgi:hypothetical protein
MKHELEENKDIISVIDEESRRLITPFTDKEKEALSKFISVKKDNLYTDFINALKNSRYGPFMIEGKIGEARQAYYKTFYVNLLSDNLDEHLRSRYNIVRVVSDTSNDTNVYMNEIFNRVYEMYLTERVFLGNYLTHSNSMEIGKYNLILVKYNDRQDTERGRKITTIEYKIHTGIATTIKIGKTRIEQMYRNILSVIDIAEDSVNLDFDNNLYDDLGWKIRAFFDDNMDVVRYKPLKTKKDERSLNINIKGLFSTNDKTGLLLTSDGKVYIKGRCDNAIGLNAITLLKTKYNNLPYRASTHYATAEDGEEGINFIVRKFTPVKIDTNLKIIYIFGVNEQGIFLVDEKLNIYEYNWNAQRDGFTLLLNVYLPLDFPFAISSVNIPMIPSMYTFDKGNKIVCVSGLYAITSQPKIFKDLSRFTNNTLLIKSGDDENLDKELLEFENGNNRVLLFSTRKENIHEEVTVIVVGLSNEKLYFFLLKGSKVKLKAVVDNQPALWNENDLWKFQCHHCGIESSPYVKLFKDVATKTILCGKTCQIGYYEDKFHQIMMMMNTKTR